MKILITGGQGYIARNLKSSFELDGHTVFAPKHSELNLKYKEDVKKYIHSNNFDIIIHTAAKGIKKTEINNFANVFLPNISMFENLCSVVEDKIPIITFGSGAEFDRRYDISSANEESVFNKYPIDPYGLSKNLITRQSITNYNNIYILRLFGCFNYDEDDTRFIKASILNSIRNYPINIHKDKMMDYFFMDDVYTVIKYIIKNKGPRNINLVYNGKMYLSNIAEIIQQYTKQEIIVNDPEIDKHYTGDGSLLENLNIPLIGLVAGIKQTFKKLR